MGFDFPGPDAGDPDQSYLAKGTLNGQPVKLIRFTQRERPDGLTETKCVYEYGGTVTGNIVWCDDDQEAA